MLYISREAEEFLPELENSESGSEIHLTFRQDRQPGGMAWNREGGVRTRSTKTPTTTTYDRELIKPRPSTTHGEEDTGSGMVAMVLMVTVTPTAFTLASAKHITPAITTDNNIYHRIKR